VSPIALAKPSSQASLPEDLFQPWSQPLSRTKTKYEGVKRAEFTELDIRYYNMQMFNPAFKGQSYQML